MGGKGSGRKARPVEAHVIEGTYKPSLHGPLDPERFVFLAPLPDEIPPCLDAYGRAVWERLYAKLIAIGMLTEGERDTFLAYCFAAGTLERALDELRASGGIVRPRKRKGAKGSAQFELTEDDGKLTVSPWYRIAREAMADLARFAASLGLTAVDRARVVKAKKGDGGKLPTTRPKTSLDLLAKGVAS